MSSTRVFNIGDRIGDYTLIRKLGAGGMGEVWLVEYGLVRTRRALKIPYEHTLKKEDVLKEAHLWNTATPHDHIVPILEAREEEGMILIASEYHPDGSLTDWLDKHGGKAPNQESAARMVLGILEGLHHLHTLPQPIIHRDIKPANVLLKKEMPRLADFGLARLLEETWSGMARGTLHYMAPEAYSGHRTVQTDIWSVGVLLYKLLVGRLPFPQTDQAELMNAIIMGDYAPLPPSIPRSLQQVITRALQKKPADRYSSALEMQESLAEAAKEIKNAVDYFNAGCECFRERRYYDAIGNFDKAVELDPNYAEAYYKRGEANFENNFQRLGADKAVEDLNRAATLRPDLAGAFFVRAKVYRALNKIDLAIADLDQAITLKPDEFTYLLNRGEAYISKGEHENAIKDFDRAVEIKSDDPTPYYGRGVAYGRIVRLARANAIKALNKAVNLSEKRLINWPQHTPAESVKDLLQQLKRENSFVLKKPSLQRLASSQNFGGYLALGLVVILFLLFGLYLSANRNGRLHQEAEALAGRVQAAESKIKEVEEKSKNKLKEADEVTQAVVFGEKKVCWVAKLVNRTKRVVTCTIYSENITGDKDLQPGEELTLWRRNTPPEVEFLPGLTILGNKKEKKTLISKGMLGGPPDETNQARAVVNYFSSSFSGISGLGNSEIFWSVKLYYDTDTQGR